MRLANVLKLTLIEIQKQENFIKMLLLGYQFGSPLMEHS